MKIEQEILKELEGLRDFENYSKNPSMNTGYRTAILDAIDIVTKCFCKTPNSTRLHVAYCKQFKNKIMKKNDSKVKKMMGPDDWDVRTPKELADEAERELKKKPNINKEVLALIADFREWSENFTKAIDEFVNYLRK